MPMKYKEVYNGSTIVLRKVVKNVSNTVKDAPIVATVKEIQTIAPAKILDAKAMRAKLTAELFKTL